ncbi:hypothetical protein F183_A54110 [Bryobacterales bacterium F-183]|nr:hypothetical protein F183_A54110 [Bryobacterales bacterium F-183]
MGLAAPIAWFCLALSVKNEDPKTLVERAIEKGLQNRAKSANWLGREDIKRYALDKKNVSRMTAWITYEASKLEGENYYRVIARDGKPLSKKETAKEQQRMDAEAERRRHRPRERAKDSNAKRFSVSLQQLLVFHTLRYTGEETVRGRKIWMVEAGLRDSAPQPNEPDDLALAGDLTLWIDQETGLVSMQELRVTRDWGSYSPGSMVRYDMDWNGTVMLPTRIMVQLARSRTEQVYTEYRQFGAEAVIQFDTSAPAK